MRFRTKVVGLSVLGIVATGAIVVSMTALQKGTLRDQTLQEMDRLARSECSKLAHNVYLMLQVQHETLANKLAANLRVAQDQVTAAGGPTASPETITWQATDQFTKQKQEVTLAKLLVGNQWLGANDDINVESPFVDKVHTLVGDT
jgi:methyl-accepting chemotaxis protein